MTFVFGVLLLAGGLCGIGLATWYLVLRITWAERAAERPNNSRF